MKTNRALMSTINRKTYQLLKELAPDVSKVLLKRAVREAPADGESMVRVVDTTKLADVLAALYGDGSRADQAGGAEVKP